MDRYICPRELLPVVESALAAEGYVIEPILQRAVGHARITMMTCGGSVVALHEDMAREWASVIIYAHGSSPGLSILATLPWLVPESRDLLMRARPARGQRPDGPPC